MTLQEQLIRDEGMRLKAYQDSRGIWSIGIGHNLQAKAIPQAAVMFIFETDLADTETEVKELLPWTVNLDAARYAVVVNMAFNLGVHGLLKFRLALAAMQRSDWPEAAKEMLDSDWKDQVGSRAHRLAQQMETGSWV